MKNKIALVYILLFFYNTSVSQSDELFNRLRAINPSGTTFYNVDGMDFTSRHTFYEFDDKNIKKAYRENKIKKKDSKVTDKDLGFENYKVVTQESFENGLIAIKVTYFVKNKNNQISVFWFSFYDQENRAFERKMIDLILNNTIPKSCFSSIKTDSINFAGRIIKLGVNCNWMNTNNIQCPYYGQMNWSLHKTKASADLSLQNQLKATKVKNGGKIISEEEVSIVFEGITTKAKKVYYDLTGVTSLLASMSGGKNLTIYYVSEKVRDNYVSCVLSFWNNDNINSSGLPTLLEEVMNLVEQ